MSSDLGPVERLTGTGHLRVDAEGGLVHASPGARALLGLPVDDVDAAHILERAHPSERQVLGLMLRTGRPTSARMTVGGMRFLRVRPRAPASAR